MAGADRQHPVGGGVGSQAEVSRPAPHPEQLPPTHVARLTAGSGTKRPRARELSCLTRGRLCLLAAPWLGETWPEAWPHDFPAARPLPAARQRKQLQQRERQRVKRRKRKAARRAAKGKGKRAA